MQAALIDLADRKLRDAKRQTQKLVAQWQATIQQIMDEEKRVGCRLLPKDIAIHIPGDLARQIPTANYLTVVDIRNRVNDGWNASVNHARSSLWREIEKLGSARKAAIQTRKEARSEHESYVTEAKRFADDHARWFHPPNPKEHRHGCGFLISAVISEIVLVGFCISSYSQLARAPAPASEWAGFAVIAGIAALFGGWLVGPLLLMFLTGAGAARNLKEVKRRLQQTFDLRHSALAASAAKSQKAIDVAQDALSSLPASICDVVVAPESGSGEPDCAVEAASTETQKDEMREMLRDLDIEEEDYDDDDDY